MSFDSDWNDLDRFRHSGAKIGVPYVTLSKRKSITLSAGFVHKAQHQISNSNYVILYFSKSKNAIVFDFTSDKNDSGSIKMSKGSNVNIAGRSFFNYYMIDADKAEGKYIAKLENIPNIGERWVVYLNDKQLEE
ncbi:TPA: hypothetical protein JBD08_12460 [Legionella pneumophila subsp. pneumophila]|nr:hypothetical protein [Legionella pneumophila subsp. pneumophila]HCC3234323.1 hypothetical protein [Legionella pneumophila subsp. pneumophila]